jgi:hypothetical protein
MMVVAGACVGSKGTTVPGGAVPSGTLVATDDGLVLTTVLDHSEISSGKALTGRIWVHNGRASPVAYSSDWCGGPATMTMTLPLPLEPPGRKWTGVAAALKTYALTQGYGPGAVPAAAPVRIYVPFESCSQGGGDLTLAPGETATSTISWVPAIVAGVPALPGAVPFTITVNHDPAPRPPEPSLAPGAALPSYVESFQQLTVSGDLTIGGSAPKLVSAGQAVDALLANRTFAAWLAKQPETSWANVNLFLENFGKTKVVPAGPSWDIEVFREPHNYAIGFVDPFTGLLRSVAYSK